MTQDTSVLIATSWYVLLWQSTNRDLFCRAHFCSHVCTSVLSIHNLQHTNFISTWIYWTIFKSLAQIPPLFCMSDCGSSNL